MVLLAIVLGVTAWGARRLGFSKPDEITIVFCGSKKSLASGVPIANVLFSGPMVGMVVLPVMLFHQFQLMACAVLARHWTTRHGAAPHLVPGHLVALHRPPLHGASLHLVFLHHLSRRTVHRRGLRQRGTRGQQTRRDNGNNPECHALSPFGRTAADPRRQAPND